MQPEIAKLIGTFDGALVELQGLRTVEELHASIAVMRAGFAGLRLDLETRSAAAKPEPRGEFLDDEEIGDMEPAPAL